MHFLTGGDLLWPRRKQANFALRDAKGNEEGVFRGKSPRQAALKAANTGKIAQTSGSGNEEQKKCRTSTGERKQVKKPAGAPAQMLGGLGNPSSKKEAPRCLKIFDFSLTSTMQ